MKKTLFAVSFIILQFTNAFPQSNALQFNGNGFSGPYVNVSSNSNDFNVGSTFTFEAWINPTTGSNGNQTIISKGGGNGSIDNSYIFQVQSGTLQFYNSATTASPYWFNSGYTISNDVWTHVAVTYDNTNLKFYVNGSLVTSVVSSLSLTPGNNDFYIGRQGSSCNCNRFYGQIDEVRVWNYARSASEISANMSCIASGATSGLIAQYNFNQGIANGNNSAITTLIDNSGNGHTGNLQGFTGLSGGSVSNFTAGITDCPAAPSSVVANPVAICPGTTAALSAVSTGNNINWYTVSTGGSALGTSASAANFTVNPGGITTYYAEAVTIPATTQVYYIPVSQLIAMSGDCGGIQAKYLPGAGTAGFDWTDVLPVGATITSITVDFAIGVECSGEVRTPTLNGVNQPSFSVSGDCNCNPTGANGVKTVTVSSANYNVGGLNQFRITSANSFGLMLNAALANNYAKVTVNVVPTTAATSSSRTPVTVFIQNPEINLQYSANTANILKGDNAPSTADGTNFGIVNIGYSQSESFTIQNTGTTNLSVGGIAIGGANAGVFSINGIGFPAIITPGSSAAFNLVFISSTQGTKTASIAILNDDCNESYYDFTVSGIADYTTPLITGISSSQTVCSGVGTTLAVTALGTNLTYQWYKDANPIAGAVASSISFTGIAATATGLYAVVVGGLAGNTTSAGINLLVDNAFVGILASANTICAGEAVTLSGTNANTYTFTGGVLNGIPFFPTVTGVYSVTGTSSFGCVTKTFTTITVNSLPITNVGNPAICIGQTANITATGAVSYLWNEGTASNILTVAPVVTSVYTVTGSSAQGCENSRVSTVTVNALPVINTNNPTICAGQVANLTASGGTFYNWSNGAATNPNPVSPSVTTNYVVTVTSAQGCVNTQVSTVTVNALPLVSIDGIDIICVGNVVSLTASGANTYLWSNAAVGDVVAVSPSVTSSFTATGTDFNGCTNNSTFTVTVTSQPTVGISGTKFVCVGNATTLTGFGANTYQWSNGSNINSIIIAPTVSGIISVLGIVSAGCQDADIVNITVNSLPNISIAGVSTVCSGTPVNLSASGASTYTWSNASVTSAISFIPVSSQNITVSGTDAKGCINAAQTFITVNTLPLLNSALSPNTVQYGQNYVASISNAVGQVYSIVSGLLPSGIIFDENTGIVSGTATGAGNANFLVKATNQFCQATQLYTLTVTKAALQIQPKDSSIYLNQAIPASFSGSVIGLVNGDNVNVKYATNATAASLDGVYAITVASISGNNLANYSITTSAGVLTILPRVKVTIAGGNLNRTYGVPNTLSGIIYINGNSFKANTGTNTLLGSDIINLDFSSNANFNSNVGLNYPVTPSIQAGGSDLAKYEITTIIGKLQIKPSKIIIKAYDAFVNFGEGIPTTFPGTILGTVLAQDSIRIENKADASTALGVYLITPEVTGDGLSNYSLIVFPGNLYVRYGLSVVGNNVSKTYFQQNPAFSGTVNGLQPTGQNVTVTWVSAAMQNSVVGNYPVTPVVVGSDLINYYVISTAGTLLVNPVPLTVSANNFVKVQGEANPQFSASIFGLVNNESVDVSFTTEATTASPVGDYPIFPSVTGAALTNYDLTTIAGILSVGSTTSPINVTAGNFSKVYGQPNPDFTGVVTGLKQGDDVQISYFTAVNSLTGVGNYPISIKIMGTDVTKYTFVTVSGSLSITPAPLSVAPNSIVRNYGSRNPTLSGTVIGAVNGDFISDNYQTLATQASDAGVYSIIPLVTGAELANYALTTTTGSLTVSAVNLTLVGAKLSKVYGTPNPQFAYNIFGFALNENIEVLDVLPVPFSVATTTSNVGEYEISFSDAADVNYTFSYISGSLEITRATQTITVSSTNAKVKTGETITLSASASSGLPISIAIADMNIVTNTGLTLQGLVDGTTSLTLSQSGNQNYFPASDVTVAILSTSTGIVSTTLFQISGKDTVLMNSAETYSLPNKAGYTYRWSYTGRNIVVNPSFRPYEFNLAFNSETENGTVFGKVYDEAGNLLKTDSIAVFVVKYTDAELASNPELKEKIAAAELVRQLEPLACEPVVTDCENAFILSFNLGKRINNRTTCSKSGYGDYTTYGKIDSLIMGNSYAMRASSINRITNASFFAIWIDYDNNGSFDDPDDFIKASFNSDSVFELKNVVIKNNDSYIGPRRVRVSMKTTGNFSNSQSSCPQEGTVGETEDYLIYIRKQDALEAPSLLTPNEDGKNDLFIIKGINPKQDNKLTIMDRWGKTVYDKESYANDWGGGKLEDGTYFYFFVNGTDNIKGYFEIRTR